MPSMKPPNKINNINYNYNNLTTEGYRTTTDNAVVYWIIKKINVCFLVSWENYWSFLIQPCMFNSVLYIYTHTHRSTEIDKLILTQSIPSCFHSTSRKQNFRIKEGMYASGS